MNGLARAIVGAAESVDLVLGTLSLRLPGDGVASSNFGQEFDLLEPLQSLFRPLSGLKKRGSVIRAPRNQDRLPLALSSPI
jgi:hypothetical protein